MPIEAPSYRDTMDELRALGGGGRQPPIEPRGPTPEDPDMEARLKRVEDDVRGLRTDVGALGQRLAAVEAKLDILVTQVVAKIPSGWQMFSIMMATLVGGVTVLGAAAALARWLKLIAP